jgi:heme exporter protein A
MELDGIDLTCVRGGRRVFQKLRFTATAGIPLVLTGHNGAGKSSLLRMIAGLIRPAAGSIVLAGGDPELSVAEQAHYAGHLDPFKPALTVTENLRFWARFLNGRAGPEHSRLAVRSLETVGLSELADLPAGYLSAGQRRRLSLARLITVPRPVWLLDEPTAALDVLSQEMLRLMMRDHLAAGGILVAATHMALGLDPAAELRLGARESGADNDDAADETDDETAAREPEAYGWDAVS